MLAITRGHSYSLVVGSTIFNMVSSSVVFKVGLFVLVALVWNISTLASSALESSCRCRFMISTILALMARHQRSLPGRHQIYLSVAEVLNDGFLELHQALLVDVWTLLFDKIATRLKQLALTAALFESFRLVGTSTGCHLVVLVLSLVTRLCGSLRCLKFSPVAGNRIVMKDRGIIGWQKLALLLWEDLLTCLCGLRRCVLLAN